MLDALKFAGAAIGKKALVPGTTHFLIRNGMVRATNGNVAMAAPIELALDCAPEGLPMLNAIANCEEATQMTMLANGRLRIKSGKFQANINCTDAVEIHTDPQGKLYDIHGEQLLDALKTVTPFMGTDASRKWVCGVLLKQGSAFATNNVCIAQYWFGTPFPIDCVLSSDVVEALLKIKEVPTHVQLKHNEITFHYPSKRWLKSTLVENGWPNNIEKILNVESTPSSIDPLLFEALERLKKFATDHGRVYIESGVVRTHYDEGEGASCAISDDSIQGVFALDILMLLKGIVSSADLTRYPQACTFFGDNFRGVLMGLRV